MVNMYSTYFGTDFSKILPYTRTHTHTHKHTNTHTHTHTHSGDFPSAELLLATLVHYLALHRRSAADIARVKREERLRARRLKVPICTLIYVWCVCVY